MVMLATYQDANGAFKPYYNQQTNSYAQTGNSVSSSQQSGSSSGSVKTSNTAPVVNGGYMKPVYTPNPYTAAQLQGMNYGGVSVPQWMLNAYANKIGQMGGNANAPLPFQVNQSGFPSLYSNGMPQAQQPQPTSPTNTFLNRIGGGKSAPAK